MYSKITIKDKDIQKAINNELKRQEVLKKWKTSLI